MLFGLFKRGESPQVPLIHDGIERLGQHNLRTWAYALDTAKHVIAYVLVHLCFKDGAAAFELMAA
jgi:hypothetical protein